MRSKRILAVIASCVLVLVMASNANAAASKKRPVISAAERALSMWEVQNVMSKHAYYHAAGMHLEELADIWVSEKGRFAKTATFSSPNWIMHGLATIKKAYGEQHQRDKEQALTELSKIYPEIENKPENIGAGSEWAMHTNTTPVIEVAGDGKTAKGIWYSPGMGLNPHFKDGKIFVGSTFFWEKYGADFIKEDGVWKLWHCQMYYDFTPRLPSSMTAEFGGSGEDMMGPPPPPPGNDKGGDPKGAGPNKDALEAGTRMSSQQEGFSDNPVKYKNWSPARVPEIMPQFPKPYYTFSETFSY